MERVEIGARVRVLESATRHAGRIGFVLGYDQDAILLREHLEDGEQFIVPASTTYRDCGAFFCGHPLHRCQTEIDAALAARVASKYLEKA